MSDYSANGAIPVEDAAVADPPTVDEVLERQRVNHPEQYDPTMQHPGPPAGDAAPEGHDGAAERAPASGDQ